MKKLLPVAFILLTINVLAQNNTSPFPVSGNVGIGTPTPTAKLEVYNFTPSGSSEMLQKWTWDPTYWWLGLEQQHFGDSHVQWNFKQKNYSTEVNLMTFKMGNVGIGTTNPQSKLEVNNSIHVYNTAPINNTWYKNIGLGMFTNIFYNLWEIKTKENSMQGFLNLNNARWGGSMSLTREGSAGNRIAFDLFSSESQPNIFTIYNDLGTTITNQISSNGISYFNGGNVGIGTTNPSTKLDVQAVNAANFGTATPCCASNYTLAVSEATGTNSRLPSIQFHASGSQEAFFRLASDARVFEIGDNQAVGVDFAIRNVANTARNVLISGKNNSYFNGGNVGIGTINPLTKLAVRGGVAINSDRNLFGALEIYHNSADDGGDKSYLSLHRGGRIAWQLGLKDDNFIIAAGGGADRTNLWETKYFSINSNGNVGIGTTAPTEKLDVNGSLKVANGIKAIGQAGSWYNGGQVLVDNIASYGRIQSYDGNTNTSKPLYLQWNGGSVVVGTPIVATLPTDYKLLVAGNVIAEKVKVKKQSSGWPDFVFAPTYKLPSLAEVESFVKKNSHLPEIPSATEIEKDGQDLGEMNRLLLKKVEELTLYMIAVEKKNKEQDLLIQKLLKK